MKCSIAVLVFALVSCSPKSENIASVPPPENHSISSGEYSNLESRVSSLEWDNMVREQTWVDLDLTSKGYQRVDTPLMPLLVSAKDVTPYLDGYKVKIQIGNPYNMVFQGVKVSYKWGVSYKFSNGKIVNHTEYQNSQKTKSCDLTETFYSGYWTEVELTVTPATSEEIQNLRISIVPSQISLLEKPARR
ncbi:MAG TPA: hypothetical protein VK327_08600 [Candidatus Paceibacterota bacterium]|nr:hypothetical protein [Candidatus Paceibacterota bacterium]